MAFAPQPEQRPSVIRRYIGLIMVMVVLTVAAIVVGVAFFLNTVLDANLPVSTLPVQAQALFAMQVSYMLTAYPLADVGIIAVALGAVLAAIFNLRSPHESGDEF